MTREDRVLSFEHSFVVPCASQGAKETDWLLELSPYLTLSSPVTAGTPHKHVTYGVDPNII